MKSELVERARFLAAGQDDPHSVTISELCDEIERMRKALLGIAAHTISRHPSIVAGEGLGWRKPPAATPES